MAYTELEVTNLIDQVTKEFNVYLAKAESTVESAASGVDGSELAKAEEAEEKKKAPEKKPESEKKEAPAAEGKEAAPAADAKAPAADAAAPEAPAEAAAEAEGEAEGEAEQAAADAAPAVDPAAAHDYDDEDMAAMVQMYQSMSRPELKAHHDAIKQCLDAMGMQDAPAPAAAAPAAPAAAAPEGIAKSEDLNVPAAIVAASPEVEILKSEVAARDTKITDLQKNLDTVTEILTRMVKKSAPAAKAVTKLEAIAKSDVANEDKVLSKNEIHSILIKKTAEPSLAKSDRDAINAYYALGQVSTTGISHLLK